MPHVVGVDCHSDGTLLAHAILRAVRGCRRKTASSDHRKNSFTQKTLVFGSLCWLPRKDARQHGSARASLPRRFDQSSLRFRWGRCLDSGFQPIEARGAAGVAGASNPSGQAPSTAARRDGGQ